MLKKLSSGYKITSSGLLVSLICFFLPWVMQSCGNEPMREYSGLQLAIGSGSAGEGYKGNVFVLLTFVAVFVILYFVIQYTGGSLTTRDTYGILVTSAVVLLILFQQFLTAPSEGVNRQVLYGLWGYITGWLLILIGGVVNLVERNKPR
jgi:hypothetical protein